MKTDSFNVYLASETLIPNEKLFAPWTRKDQMGSTKKYAHKLYVERRDSVIQMITESSLTVSEKGYGSYKALSTSIGHIYIAKDNKDADKAIKLLKDGKFPDGVISDVILRNFDPKTYYRDNNFPLTVEICNDLDSVRKYLAKNEVVLEFNWYDDYKFEDDSFWYTTEENHIETMFVDVMAEYLKNGVNEKNYRDIFELAGLDDAWLNEKDVDIYDEVIEALCRLKPISNSFNISDEAVRFTNLKEAKIKLDNFKIEKAKASNENKIIDIYVNTCKSLRYKGKLKKTYNGVLSHTFNFITNPKDGFETDLGISLLKKMYDLTPKNLFKMDKNKLVIKDAYMTILKDFGLNDEKIQSKIRDILNLPIRSALSPLNTLFNI